MRATLDLLKNETATLCGLIDYRRWYFVTLARAARGEENCYGDAWPALRRLRFNQAHPWKDYDEHGRRWRILHELTHMCTPFLRCRTADQHDEGFALAFAALQIRAFGHWHLTDYELGDGLLALTPAEAAAWIDEHAPALAASGLSAPQIGAAATRRACWLRYRSVAPYLVGLGGICCASMSLFGWLVSLAYR